MLNPRTALTKLLRLKGKFQAFRIRCIMLILEKLHLREPLFLIKKLENYLVFILCFQLEVINNFVNISFEIKNVFS